MFDGNTKTQSTSSHLGQAAPKAAGTDTQTKPGNSPEDLEKPTSFQNRQKRRPRPNWGSTNNAGWSSPVARQAHNLKAAGSNPAPATNNQNNVESNGPLK